MDYHLTQGYKDKAIVKHNVVKIKLVSKVTTVALIILLSIDVLFKFTSTKEIYLSWLLNICIIAVNIGWHLYCIKLVKQIVSTNAKKFGILTNIYISTMLLFGALITISDITIFNNLMMYTLILLVASAYFVLTKQQLVRPMIFSSLIILVGLYVQTNSLNEFLVNTVYIAILNPIAYYVSRSFNYSFEKTLKTQVKLLKEMEERKKVMKQLRDANRQLKLQSSLDPLTKLHNRHAVNEYMSKLAEQAEHSSFMMSSIMLDVDYFKQYNDTYGHITGDEALMKIGEVLLQLGEEYNIFTARWGGEEFMIVLRDANEKKLQMICEAIMYRVKQLNIKHETSLVSDVVTVSIGAHTVEVQDSKDVFQSLDKADRALYDVKKSGRNGFAIRMSAV